MNTKHDDLNLTHEECDFLLKEVTQFHPERTRLIEKLRALKEDRKANLGPLGNLAELLNGIAVKK